MTPLYRFLNSRLRAQFSWSHDNCCFFTCDWIMEIRGVDPAQDDRVTFDDMASCARVTGYFRDPVGVYGGRLAAVGIHRSERLAAGDVGLVNVPGERWPVAGIFTGRAWVFLGQDGLSTWRPETVHVLATWGVGYEA